MEFLFCGTERAKHFARVGDLKGAGIISSTEEIAEPGSRKYSSDDENIIRDRFSFSFSLGERLKKTNLKFIDLKIKPRISSRGYFLSKSYFISAIMHKDCARFSGDIRKSKVRII